MHWKHLFLVPTLLAIAPAQQTMTLRGELDEGRSTGCYYCPNVPYTIRYSETPVRSSTINLQPWKDLSLPLELTGYWDTSTTPAGLEVTGVSVISQIFQVANTARTGQPLRFTVNGAAGDFAAILFAGGSGFLPVFDSALLLDPASTTVLQTGLLTGSNLRIDLTVPDQPALIGLRFWSQGFLITAGGAYFAEPQRTLIDR